jgi:hypothetical protein
MQTAFQSFLIIPKLGLQGDDEFITAFLGAPISSQRLFIYALWGRWRYFRDIRFVQTFAIN